MRIRRGCLFGFTYPLPLFSTSFVAEVNLIFGLYCFEGIYEGQIGAGIG